MDSQIAYQFYHFELLISEGKITTINDRLSGSPAKDFDYHLAQNNFPKLYLFKENKDFLQVGVTSKPLKTAIRAGLKTKSSRGYFAKSWGNMEKITLYAWRFKTLAMAEVEDIAAELTFLLRKDTGKWPFYQNEIRINNEFPGAKLLSEKIVRGLK